MHGLSVVGLVWTAHEFNVTVWLRLQLHNSCATCATWHSTPSQTRAHSHKHPDTVSLTHSLTCALTFIYPHRTSTGHAPPLHQAEGAGCGGAGGGGAGGAEGVARSSRSRSQQRQEPAAPATVESNGSEQCTVKCALGALRSAAAVGAVHAAVAAAVAAGSQSPTAAGCYGGSGSSGGGAACHCGRLGGKRTDTAATRGGGWGGVGGAAGGDSRSLGGLHGLSHSHVCAVGGLRLLRLHQRTLRVPFGTSPGPCLAPAMAARMRRRLRRRGACECEPRGISRPCWLVRPPTQVLLA